MSGLNPYLFPELQHRRQDKRFVGIFIRELWLDPLPDRVTGNP
jgi:hypothetical protein